MLSADAQAVRAEMDDLVLGLMHMPDTRAQLRSSLGKWPGLFARLCLLFHLIAGADANARGVEEGPVLTVLQEPTARAVASYMRFVLLPHLFRADRIMFVSEQSQHAKWIAGYILAKGMDRVARRDLVQDYRELRGPEHAEMIDAVMAGLEAAGWVRPEEKKNRMRSIFAWKINPEVHFLFAERGIAERERRAAERARVAEAIRRTRGEA